MRMFPCVLLGLLMARGVTAQSVSTIPTNAAISRKLSVDTQPVWAVGGTLQDPEREFDHRNGLLGATTTRSGTIVVIDRNRLHLFEGERRIHSITGNRGAGPNEFTSLFSVCSTHQDTIVAYDFALRRVSILTRDGRVVRQFGVPEYRPMLDNACGANGTILFQESGRIVHGELSGEILLVRTSGDVVARLGRAPIRTSVVRPQLVVLPDGVLIADPLTSMLRVVNQRSQTIRTYKLDAPPEPIEPRDRLMLGPVPRYGGGSQLPAGAPGDDITHWPSYYRVLLDFSNRLWIQRFPREASEEPEWTIVQLNGEVVGTIRFPRQLSHGPPATLISADSTGVVLLRRDAEGAAFVSRHRIIKEVRSHH